MPDRLGGEPAPRTDWAAWGVIAACAAVVALCTAVVVGVLL